MVAKVPFSSFQTQNYAACTPLQCGTIRTLRPERRTSVRAEANFFDRIGRIARSFMEIFVSQLEDPEKILDQALLDMQSDLMKMRQASAQVLASQRQVEGKLGFLHQQERDWQKRAELALLKGEEGLAREALKRKQGFARNAKDLQKQLDVQRKASDQLLGNTRILEAKLQEARDKKVTLKARAASARTSKQIQEMVGAVDVSSSVAAFEKMEEKVMAIEAEAEAAGMLAAGDQLEQQFQRLAATGVDDELAAMKRRLAEVKHPTTSMTLPEKSSQPELGKRLRDEIDWEIEAIKAKVFTR